MAYKRTERASRRYGRPNRSLSNFFRGREALHRTYQKIESRLLYPLLWQFPQRRVSFPELFRNRDSWTQINDMSTRPQGLKLSVGVVTLSCRQQRVLQRGHASVTFGFTMLIITTLRLPLVVLAIANLAFGCRDRGHGGLADGEAMQDYAGRHVRILRTGYIPILMFVERL